VTNGRDAADRIRREGWQHDHRTRKAALAAASLDEGAHRLAPLTWPGNSLSNRCQPERLAYNIRPAAVSVSDCRASAPLAMVTGQTKIVGQAHRLPW